MNKNYLSGIIVLVFILGIVACFHSRNHSGNIKAMTQKILIVSMFAGQVDIELGRLVFVAGQQPQLQLTTKGPPSERLQRAWNDIRSRAGVEIIRPVKDPMRPNQPPRPASTIVTSDEPDYFRGVRSTLERQFGFVVDVAEQ